MKYEARNQRKRHLKYPSRTAWKTDYNTTSNTFKSASMIRLCSTHEVLCSKGEMLGPLRGDDRLPTYLESVKVG